jgi:hypothetical protein
MILMVLRQFAAPRRVHRTNWSCSGDSSETFLAERAVDGFSGSSPVSMSADAPIGICRRTSCSSPSLQKDPKPFEIRTKAMANRNPSATTSAETRRVGVLSWTAPRSVFPVKAHSQTCVDWPFRNISTVAEPCPAQWLSQQAGDSHRGSLTK